MMRTKQPFTFELGEVGGSGVIVTSAEYIDEYMNYQLQYLLGQRFLMPRTSAVKVTLGERQESNEPEGIRFSVERFNV